MNKPFQSSLPVPQTCLNNCTRYYIFYFINLFINCFVLFCFTGGKEAGTSYALVMLHLRSIKLASCAEKDTALTNGYPVHNQAVTLHDKALLLVFVLKSAVCSLQSATALLPAGVAAVCTSVCAGTDHACMSAECADYCCRVTRCLLSRCVTVWPALWASVANR